MSDLDFFKEKLASLLGSFNLEFRSYPEGDFGALEQIVFNTPSLGGNFDFWGNGWLGIFVYDYVADLEVCNKLLDLTEEHHAYLTDIVKIILSH